MVIRVDATSEAMVQAFSEYQRVDRGPLHHLLDRCACCQFGHPPAPPSANWPERKRFGF